MRKYASAFACVVLAAIVSFALAFTQSADPLPSWNDTPTKKAIIDFVAKVTKEGSPDFVPTAERIASFDNDGTLWAEQPMYFQLAFVIDRIKAMAPDHPEWKDKDPFKSILAGNTEAALLGGEKAVAALVAATHAGMTTDEFAAHVTTWLQTARHPRFGRPYNECTYEPMLEVLTYLRANEFKTFIVSGGGVEFMRAFAEETYGIPPEQVVGSSGVVTFEMRDGEPVLIKQPEIEFIDDGPGKPVGINRFIGRRPIIAFGNSDGDLQMLQWTGGGAGQNLCVYVHHDDSVRESAYDRKSSIGRLDKGLDEAAARQWTVVSMKHDWNRVFAFEAKP